jgi:hypothetical protein
MPLPGVERVSGPLHPRVLDSAPLTGMGATSGNAVTLSSEETRTGSGTLAA